MDNKFAMHCCTPQCLVGVPASKADTRVSKRDTIREGERVRTPGGSRRGGGSLKKDRREAGTPSQTQAKMGPKRVWLGRTATSPSPSSSGCGRGIARPTTGTSRALPGTSQMRACSCVPARRAAELTVLAADPQMVVLRLPEHPLGPPSPLAAEHRHL